LQYNQKTKSWKSVSIKNNSRTSKNGEILTQITLVTYNVCFEQDFFDQRCEHILELLQNSKVDIVCLQEVIPKFLEKLKNEVWVQQYYYLSNDNIDSSLTYGSVLLSTIQPKALRRWLLPTAMGRDCLEAEFILNGEGVCNFTVATLHLESLDFPQKRKEQLQYIKPILQSPSVTILGDFNFDSEQNYSHLEYKRDLIRKGMPFETVESIPLPENEPIENDNLRDLFPEYKDVWVDCGLIPSTDKGYTFDSQKNRMIKGYERMRYDRILLKSKYWKPTAISLLGDEPISGSKVGGAVVYPSDHFGLIMTLEINN
jgi:exonuclease III